MTRSLSVAVLIVLAVATVSGAATIKWDVAATPTTGTYSWFNGDNWVGGAVPTNASDTVADLEEDNVQRTYDINNGGAGVNLPDSRIIFGRGEIVDDTSKTDVSLADDGIVANRIDVNGAGGASPVFYVPVTADTLTSNRHGGQFYAPITVNTILANSAHQDRWQIHASPTGTIGYVQLDENRGADGDSIDGYFAFDADTSVTQLDHVWSSLQVGAGATLTVDTLTTWDYTNQDTNNNINPMVLDGDMTVSNLNIYDVASDATAALGAGTYGRIGNPNGDTEVAWITSGDGTLTVLVPEPTTMALLGFGCLGAVLRRRK